MMACGITVAVATREVCRMSADRVYMPFQVGKALHPPIEFGVTCDNSRDNISSLNGRYSELTGSCWLQESRPSLYQSLVYYRRHFVKPDNPELYGGDDKLFAVASQRIDYESLLDEMGEVIVPTERKCYIETVYSHCGRIMKEGQLEATRKFSSSFQHVVMHKGIFDEYCSWMLLLWSNLRNVLILSSCAVLERISEILLDVWLNTKRYPYAEMPIVSPEPVNWMKEGTGFLMAKFVGKKYVKSC
ncbi:glycosyl transferase [Bifidobacterium breve]|nr:glycosyl transferase [Bifidobacterium breve]